MIFILILFLLRRKRSRKIKQIILRKKQLISESDEGIDLENISDEIISDEESDKEGM